MNTARHDSFEMWKDLAVRLKIRRQTAELVESLATSSKDKQLEIMTELLMEGCNYGA